MTRLLLRADASLTQGTGHVLRCLALAEAWIDHGGQAVLLSHALHPRLARRLHAAGVGLLSLAAVPGSPDDATATARAAADLGADWIAADGYHVGSAWQEQVVGQGHKLLVFDDNGHCSHYAAHLVLNQNAHATPGPYAQRADHTALLLGPRFAVLRREFTQMGSAVEHPGHRPAQLLVTLGGSDPEAHLEGVVGALLPHPPDSRLVGLVGSHHPRAGAVEALLCGTPNATALHDAQDMAGLLSRTRLAVSAAGTTTYELAAMGVPSILLAIADNQLKSAEAVDALEAACFLGVAGAVQRDTLRNALSALWSNPERLRSLSEAGRALVDGQGAARVVRRMWGQHRIDSENLDLQPASWADRGALWSQANDPEVRARAFHPAQIPWSSHLRWLRSRLDSPDCLAFRAQLVGEDAAGADAGVVRFDRTGAATWEITVAVAAEQRGRGLGAPLIAAGCRALVAQRGRELSVLARIRPDNSASLRTFARAGFGDPSPTPADGTEAVGCWWHPAR